MKKKLLCMIFGTAVTMCAMAGCGGASDNAANEEVAEAEKAAEDEAETVDAAETSTEMPAETRPLEGEHFVIAVNATFAPFEYVDGVDENGDEVLVGLDIDFIEKLSEMLGFTYEFNDMEFNGLVGSLESGRCDLIISGISINEERDKVVDASDPYFMPRIAILSYADEEYKDLDSLKDKDVAVSFGTTYAEIATDAGTNVKELDSTALAFQELQNQNVDACIFDANQSQKFVDDNPDLNLVRNILPDEVAQKYEIKGYCVLVPEGETERLAYFDEAIDELQESGWIDELIVKWCGEDYLE